jgi:hypothetical protein
MIKIKIKRKQGGFIVYYKYLCFWIRLSEHEFFNLNAAMEYTSKYFKKKYNKKKSRFYTESEVYELDLMNNSE